MFSKFAFATNHKTYSAALHTEHNATHLPIQVLVKQQIPGMCSPKLCSLRLITSIPCDTRRQYRRRHVIQNVGKMSDKLGQRGKNILQTSGRSGTPN